MTHENLPRPRSEQKTHIWTVDPLRKNADQQVFDIVLPPASPVPQEKPAVTPLEQMPLPSSLLPSSSRASLRERAVLQLPKLHWKPVCTALFISLLTLEGGSWTAYWMLTGAPLAKSQAHAEQQSIAQGSIAGNADVLSGDGDGKLTQFLVHPYVGYVRKEGDSHAAAGQEFLRGALPVITTPAPDEAIVGIFGGSLAEQFAAQGMDALKRMLQDDPRFAGKRITLVTAAIAGHKQPQQLLALNYLLTLGQHFDLIVNIDGFNELAGPSNANIHKQVAASFPSGWYHLADRLPEPQILEHMAEVTSWRAKRQRLAERIDALPLLRNTATAYFLWKAMDRQLAVKEGKAQISLLETAATKDENDMQRGPAIVYADNHELLEDLVATWQRSSLLMQELATAQGIPYIHILQPNQYVKGSKTFTGQERKLAVHPESPYRPWVEEGYPLLQVAGKKILAQGVNFHDFTMIFRDLPETIYKDDCCHVNERGNAILGLGIGQAVALSREGNTMVQR